jgi:hypothetical protein
VSCHVILIANILALLLPLLYIGVLDDFSSYSYTVGSDDRKISAS